MRVLQLSALVSLAPASPISEDSQRWQPAGGRDLSQYKMMLPKVVKQSLSSVTKAEVPIHFKKGSKSFTEVCGLENPNGVPDMVGGSKGNRIVGGHEAAHHEWPWQVIIFMDGWSCGGSLISDEWVMTAAHCADTATYFEITAGAHNLLVWDEPHRIKITATEKAVHPNWNRTILHNDIALVKLPEKITFSEYVRPACLPPASDADSEYTGTLTTPIGWGMKHDGDAGLANKLQMVSDLPVISRAECREFYDDVVYEGLLCVNSTGGKGVCHGDSGSPLNQRIPDEENRWTQIGIASFVSNGCESGDPHGFTRVANFLEWIETTTGISLT